MRIDERDIIFARLGYDKGTPQHMDYYDRHPERLEQDEKFRELASRGGVGAVHYDELNTPIIDSCFRFLGDIKHLAENPAGLSAEKAQASEVPRELDPEKMTRKIKGLAEQFHVKLVGIAEMKPDHYYTYRGRNASTYGQSVDENLPYGIVLAVEMEPELVFRAPRLPEALASVKCYTDAAVAGMILTYYIRELGFEARNHMDGNYMVLASRVAESAGLGEFGRHGLLVTPEYGPRVRFSVITTNLPLIPDVPKPFGLQSFCESCGICAANCPGKAISKTPASEIEGTLRWQSSEADCFERWMQFGTDCGICMASCPFSLDIPKELLFNISNAEIAEKVLISHKEKYGVRPVIMSNPQWME